MVTENEGSLTFEERRSVAVKAVNRLIADAEAKRLLQNRELAEVIAACIQDSTSAQLRTLKWLLKEQELERPDLEIREFIN
jgi:hypothetical protein